MRFRFQDLGIFPNPKCRRSWLNGFGVYWFGVSGFQVQTSVFRAYGFGLLHVGYQLLECRVRLLEVLVTIKS